MGQWFSTVLSSNVDPTDGFITTLSVYKIMSGSSMASLNNRHNIKILQVGWVHHHDIRVHLRSALNQSIGSKFGSDQSTIEAESSLISCVEPDPFRFLMLFFTSMGPTSVFVLHLSASAWNIEHRHTSNNFQ